ncbi:MAG: hypothetical protein A2146_00650 [Actinobacteria bacterium RBG_16_67_10]|nr:MAG: hypothetical protein A2146_00650 [Actinobacteria bacterium RBG_16_67_10]
MFEEPYFFPTVSRLRTLQPSAFSRATFSAAAFWAAVGTVPLRVTVLVSALVSPALVNHEGGLHVDGLFLGPDLGADLLGPLLPRAEGPVSPSISSLGSGTSICPKIKEPATKRGWDGA